MESKIWDILYQSKINKSAERKSVVSRRFNFDFFMKEGI